ncbi:MAG TPA: hypothetical protein VHB25_16505 [Gemmatimonadaceae bacterium]|nr:hypothetical protein [Gemmatimonadaceae bacterium]
MITGLAKAAMRRVARWLGTPSLGARRFMWGALIIATSGACLAAYRRAHGQPETMNPRAAERERLRYLRARVVEYATLFHRPAFTLDSVAAHLDSAEAAQFESLRTNPWGSAVGYAWGPRSFELISYISRDRPRPRWIVERAALPEAAQGHLNAWGSYVPDHAAITSPARDSSTPARP